MRRGTRRRAQVILPRARSRRLLWLDARLLPVLAVAGLILAGFLVSRSAPPWHSHESTDEPSELAPQIGELSPDLLADPTDLTDFAEASPYAEIARPLATPTPGPLKPTTYTIQDGDTLLEIADRFGLRPESLLWANDLPDPDLLSVGQKLTIPPIDGLLYEIEPGETLWTVVTRYGLDVGEVATANGIADPDALPIGVALVLPGARPVAPSRVVAAGPNSPPDAVSAPSGGGVGLAALGPLPPNVPELLSAAWLRTAAPNALFSGPEPGARRYAGLPGGVRLERTGDLAGRRIPVRDPGDGRTRQAMSGWIEVDNLEPARAPSPRELPRAYPADTRMDISHTFVPFRGQLDGSPYAEANCGPTSVGMVLESFGISVPLSKLRAQALDAQRMWGHGTGTLITALAQVVESHGLQVHDLRRGGEIYRWTLDDVREHLRLRRPIIVQVRYRSLPGREGAFYYGDHYIVLTGVLDDGFLYNDPIDHDGLGWDRVISGERLWRAMDASDRRYVRSAFAVSQ